LRRRNTNSPSAPRKGEQQKITNLDRIVCLVISIPSSQFQRLADRALLDAGRLVFWLIFFSKRIEISPSQSAIEIATEKR
jgi:hypothetical protein